MSLPAYCRTEAYEAFLRELHHIQSATGLCRAAAAIALHEETTADGRLVDEVIASCEGLAKTVASRVKSDSELAKLSHLHDVLFDVVGFAGETEDYYNPSNSYLSHVLKTQRGLPISLVLLYRTVGSSLGLRIEGVNAPGHFLAGVACRDATGDSILYVDPFYSGKLLTKQEALDRIAEATERPVLGPKVDALVVATPTDWLRRILLNLQAAFANRNQERDFLAMQELEALLPS